MHDFPTSSRPSFLPLASRGRWPFSLFPHLAPSLSHVFSFAPYAITWLNGLSTRLSNQAFLPIMGLKLARGYCDALSLDALSIDSLFNMFVCLYSSVDFYFQHLCSDLSLPICVCILSAYKLLIALTCPSFNSHNHCIYVPDFVLFLQWSLWMYQLLFLCHDCAGSPFLCWSPCWSLVHLPGLFLTP